MGGEGAPMTAPMAQAGRSKVGETGDTPAEMKNCASCRWGPHGSDPRGLARSEQASRAGMSSIVNRRYELTPPNSIISVSYRADRRRDPTPNDSHSVRLTAPSGWQLGPVRSVNDGSGMRFGVPCAGQTVKRGDQWRGVRTNNQSRRTTPLQLHRVDAMVRGLDAVGAGIELVPLDHHDRIPRRSTDPNPANVEVDVRQKPAKTSVPFSRCRKHRSRSAERDRRETNARI